MIERGNRGPQLSLSVGMQQAMALQVEPRFEGLDDNDRESILNAASLWAKTPKQTMSIPMRELVKTLTGKDADVSDLPEEAIEVSFVRIPLEQMAMIDFNERAGVSMGEQIFVAEEVDDRFVPLVVLNLAVLRMMAGEGRVAEFLGRSNIFPPQGEASHWTANLTDIALAENVFEGDHQAFLDYLKWRKEIERSDFFRDPRIHSIFDKLINDSEFRSTALPSERGHRVKRSWELSGVMTSGFYGQNLGKLFRDLRVSVYHMLFQRIHGQENFKPMDMLRLLDMFGGSGDRVEKRRINGRNRKVVDLSTQDTDLEAQAYLLTENIAGDTPVLDDLGEGIYALRPHAIRSIRSLRELITAFSRRSVQGIEGKVAPGLIAAITSGRAVQLALGDGSGAGRVELNLDDLADAKRVLAEKSALLAGQMGKIDTVLGRYQKLVDKLGDGGVDLVPGDITSQVDGLKAVRGTLGGQLEALDPTILNELAQLREDLALLGLGLKTE